MKRVMQTWLPASTALLEMMIFHIPLVSTGQRYRVENLYEGPLDDQYATSIRNYAPEGPLMVYVSNFIPAFNINNCSTLVMSLLGKSSSLSPRMLH